jgi:hypothetical protein
MAGWGSIDSNHLRSAEFSSADHHLRIPEKLLARNRSYSFDFSIRTETSRMITRGATAGGCASGGAVAK